MNNIQDFTPIDGEEVLIYDEYSPNDSFHFAKWFESDKSFWEIDIGIGNHYHATHWISIDLLKHLLSIKTLQ